MPDDSIRDEDLVVDIPDTGQAVEVEIEPLELTSEDSKGVGSGEPEEEHLEYSKKVKRRIDKLTKKAREMERQQAAAVDFARGMQAENSQLMSRVRDLDQGYVAEYGDRVATQADSLSRDLETAIATNDTSAQVDLNKKIARLAVEEERVRSAQQQQYQAAQAEQYQQQQYQQQQYQQQQSYQQPPVPARPDPKAATWAEDNSWFGENDAMTFAAFGIHKTLIEEEGFDTESPEYYSEIDRRIRDAFPHRFGEQAVPTNGGRRPQQSVASATRTGSTGRKTIRLSPSEVAIAQKLGVPLDEYAKHKR